MDELRDGKEAHAEFMKKEDEVGIENKAKVDPRWLLAIVCHFFFEILKALNIIII